MNLEYIVILLLFLILLFIIITFLKIKRVNESDIFEKLLKIETEIIKEISDFKFDFSKIVNNDFDTLRGEIENKLVQINDKVNERIDVNFEKTNKTFNNVLERLAKIDEAQKKITILLEKEGKLEEEKFETASDSNS